MLAGVRCRGSPFTLEDLLFARQRPRSRLLLATADDKRINTFSAMKYSLLATLVLSLAAFTTSAQFGGPSAGPKGPSFGPTLLKAFGENTAFTAAMIMEAKEPKSGDPIVMPGKLLVLDGNSRFEMDISQVKGARMSAEMGAQLKGLGMAEMIAINRPDKKALYLIYPGLQSYAEQPLPAKEAVTDISKVKAETTELGKETIDGHPCVKNKLVVTDTDGAKHEVTVWNATDLKNFPVRIDMTEGGQPATLKFKDVKFAKSDAALFAPPAGFTRYESVQTMMMQGMMKMLGNGGGLK